MRWIMINCSYINKQSTKGFTLLEIMVVLIILGILTSFVVSTYSHYTERSHLDIAQMMLSNYAQEITAFQLKTGRVPDTEEEYETFKKQMTHDPNLDHQYRGFFQVQFAQGNKELLAVPQKKHRYPSYAKMKLDDYSIFICKHAPALYKAEGGECKKAITSKSLNM